MEERGQKRDEQKRERRHAQQQQNNTILQEQHQLLMMDSTAIASESEETMAINTPTANMATTGKQQQQSSLSNNSASTQFSTFNSRMDDEDPIFTLDEEVHAKSGERTRHYTADFDPTVSDDDEFPKEIGNLHGGRAYSVSTRFPPRIRHSGRSGHLQNTTGIFHKLHGLAESAGGHPAAMVPASLPIQISRGFNWPPRELVGSLSEEEESGGHQAADKTGGGGNIPEASTERGRAKTAVNPMVTSELAAADNAGHHQHQMGQQQHGSEREEDGNLYGRMQAYSRSIQRVDDPERIFGERPHRRFSMIIKNSGGGPASDEAGDHQQQDDGSGGENIPPAAPFEGGPPHHHVQPPSTTSLAHHHPTISSSSSTSIPAPTGRTGTAIGGGATPRVIVPASLRG